MARPVVTEWIGRDVSASRTADKVAAKYTVAAGKFERAGGRLQGLGQVTDKVGLSFLNAGTLAAGAGTAAVAFYTDSVRAASDLNETTSKTQAVFGDAAAEVFKFGKTAATSVGQSRQQAEEAVATFGNLFTALAIGQKPAADMSIQLDKLAGDLASFNNVDPAQVLEDLRSGLLGESEPLRKYGVALSEAVVQQEAMRETGKASAKQLSEGEKVIARYQLILQNTTTAQGDFARTSDGLANSQRILNAEIENTKAAVGEALLPVLTELTHVATDVAGAIGVLNEKTDGAAIKFLLLGPVFTLAEGSIRGLGRSWRFLTGQQEEASKSATSTSQTQAQLKAAQDAATASAEKAKAAQHEEAAALQQVKEKVAGIIPLFEGYKAASDVTAGKILANLHTEVSAYSNWAANVQTLLRRGASPAAVQALSEKGPAYVAAFVHASDKQLQDLSRSFRERTRAAGRVATEEARLQGGKAGAAAARAMEASFHPFLRVPPPRVGSSGQTTRNRALQHGGILTEPVLGVGLQTGTQYTLAERGPERVTPLRRGASAGAGAIGDLHLHYGAIQVYPSTGMNEQRVAEITLELIRQAADAERRRIARGHRA